MEHPWINVLKNWPPEIPRKGLLITTFGESVEFCSYMLMGTILLLERERPDSQNGRRIMIELSNVAVIKVVDPIQMETFTKFGFTVPTPG